jgi:chemotaxis protein methyltransferase CheR
VLGTKPFIRIWHAGCSTGEEVYSMAVLLKEADLLRKSLLYATDLNPSVLEKVRKGNFPLNLMKQYSESYITSGGHEGFFELLYGKYGQAKFDNELVRKDHYFDAQPGFRQFIQ